MDIELIDAHCHLGSTDYIPKAFLTDVAGTLAAKMEAYNVPTTIKQIANTMFIKNQDSDGNEIIKEMDNAGISHSVLLVPDFTFNMDCEFDLDIMAQKHAIIKERFPGRFSVLIGAHPDRGDQGVELFRKHILDYKLDGLKLYPPCGYSPSDQRLDPYYEICAEYELPVLLHTGPTAQSLAYRYAKPEYIEGAARRFPKVNFILAHGGVSNIDESIILCEYLENVYMDIGGFTGTAHPLGWVTALRNLFSRGMNHKIIFGTDWPIFKLSGGMKGVVDEFKNAFYTSMKKEDLILLTSGNARRIMHIDG